MIMASRIPSAESLLKEALKSKPQSDVNLLHAETFELMVYYRSKYYESRVDDFLSELDLPPEINRKVKEKLLEPVVVKNREYSNFMEEVSRRVSQAFQPISGRIAELCAERELLRIGLVEDIHFTIRKERTDIIVYYPNTRSAKARHRIEVKNVSLRERATRGLAFDGDSLFGFFNQPKEFTQSNVEILNDLCEQTKGYCYAPPNTLEAMSYRGARFRPNTLFGKDMAIFVSTGKLP